MIRIYIDARERDFLSYIGDIGQVTVVNMAAGDHAVLTDDHAMLVERKTYRDFISSYRNGRLWEQLVRMISQERFEGLPVVRRLLVIEHSELDASIDELSRLGSSVIGAQLECIFTYHVPVVFLEGRSRVERFLRVLVKREGGKERQGPAFPVVPSTVPQGAPPEGPQVLLPLLHTGGGRSSRQRADGKVRVGRRAVQGQRKGPAEGPRVREEARRAAARLPALITAGSGSPASSAGTLPRI